MKKNINTIKIGNNRRIVDSEKVKELAESILQIGLINPITNTLSNILVAGQHRLEAHKQLGLTEIECNVIVGEDERLFELIEIDENLIRNELHWIENDEQIVRRKDIYELLHPESVLGNKLKNLKQNRNTDGDLHHHQTKYHSLQTHHRKQALQGVMCNEVYNERTITPEIKEALRRLNIAKTDGAIIAKLNGVKQLQVIEQLQKKPDDTVKEALLELQKVRYNGHLLGCI